MTRARELFVVLAAQLIGCGDPPAPAVEAPPTASTPASLASASAQASSSVAPLALLPPLPVEPPSIAASPLASSSSPEQRSEAVLALLAGGEPATRLPIRATSAGKDFDPNLRDKVAPQSHLKPPSVRMGTTSVTEGLPPEVVQRIVRQNFGRFRLCYENGLRSAPTIAGRVEVRFSISKAGTVTSTKATSATLPRDVVTCVEKTFNGLSFPEPEGGKKVDVVYPINFAPGDSSNR